jgi:hypothetical protein
VIVAHEYGAAICTIIDIDRFALYDSLRIPRPESTSTEQSTNVQLMKLLSHYSSVDLRYEYPQVSDDAAKDLTGT